MSTKSVGLTVFCDTLRGMAQDDVAITPEQSRAARGWLDWSQEDLAKRANVSLSTVRDFEKGRRTPIANNLDAMRRALEGGGLKMVFGPKGEPSGVKKTR